MPKLPNGLVICASTLLCAAVVALQQAESYAARLEAPAQALSELLLRLPSALRSAGSLTLASKLNTAEKSQIASLAALISPEDPMGEEASFSEESAPAETPAAIAAEPTPVEAPTAVVAEPTPVEAPTAVAAEPTPVEAPAAVAAEPIPEEAPAAVAAEPTPVETPAAVAAEPVETIPLVSSRWRELLVLSPATPQARSLFPAGLRPVVAEAQPATPAEAQPLVQASSEPTPVEVEPQPAEPTPVAQLPVSLPQPPAAELPAVPVPTEQPALTQAPPMRCRIMMVGDSLMEDLGPRTHRALNRRKGLDFVVSAKFSTGLCRPDFFNWPAHMREVIAKRKPDLVIFFIGANDGLSIKEGKRLVPTGGEAWRAAYGRKMEEVVGIAQEAGAAVIWVELPAIGGRYNKLLHETQKAQREYCEAHGLISLRTDPILSGEWGKFAPFGQYKGKTVRLRRQDDTHLTPDGNMKVLDALLPIVEQQLISFYLAHPERHLSEAEVAKIKSVPAIYTCQYTPTKKKKAADSPQPAAPAPAQP